MDRPSKRARTEEGRLLELVRPVYDGVAEAGGADAGICFIQRYSLDPALLLAAGVEWRLVATGEERIQLTIDSKEDEARLLRHKRRLLAKVPELPEQEGASQAERRAMIRAIKELTLASQPIYVRPNKINKYFECFVEELWRREVVGLLEEEGVEELRVTAFPGKKLQILIKVKS